jgi:hypothetical protein
MQKSVAMAMSPVGPPRRLSDLGFMFVVARVRVFFKEPENQE